MVVDINFNSNFDYPSVDTSSKIGAWTFGGADYGVAHVIDWRS